MLANLETQTQFPLCPAQITEFIKSGDVAWFVISSHEGEELCHNAKNAESVTRHTGLGPMECQRLGRGQVT